VRALFTAERLVFNAESRRRGDLRGENPKRKSKPENGEEAEFTCAVASDIE
jgi:hypothetical protein